MVDVGTLRFRDERAKTHLESVYAGTHAYYNMDSEEILVASVNDLSNDSYLQEFIRLLNHEVLHSILHEEVGREACVQLDNIDDLFILSQTKLGKWMQTNRYI